MCSSDLVNTGEDSIGLALAAWMIVITVVTLLIYWAGRSTKQRCFHLRANSKRPPLADSLMSNKLPIV